MQTGVLPNFRFTALVTISEVVQEIDFLGDHYNEIHSNVEITFCVEIVELYVKDLYLFAN